MSPDAEDRSPSPESGIDDDSSIMAAQKIEHTSTDEASPSGSASAQPTKNNAKDPLRPRRKKARRACFACQRAHLTCGDERPCTRCIKRGLQDQCQDGVRKKAKYLHDAPAEALVPNYHQHYHMNANSQSMASVPGATTATAGTHHASQHGHYYVQSASPPFPQQFGPINQPGSMGPPMLNASNMVGDISGHQNVDPAGSFHNVSGPSISPVHEMGNSLDHRSSMSGSATQSFASPFLDYGDPPLSNFNNLGFGNHFGALEFDMLAQMSSEVVNTPDIDAMNQLGSNHRNSMSYDGTNNYGFGMNQAFPTWQAMPNNNARQPNAASMWSTHNPMLDAYSVAEHTASLSDTSPSSQKQDFPAFGAGAVSPELTFSKLDRSGQSHDMIQPLSDSVHSSARKPAPFPGEVDSVNHRKRLWSDTSQIYTSIKAPYSYTQGFHALIAYLQKRFSPNTVVRIAKALAKIRPSFISCNRNLTTADLIFAEQALQRTLCEYDDFILLGGTPTIICRRTGEIAGVGKEFSIVTGWTEDVLLGKAPNLNVNVSGTLSGAQTGSSSRGVTTPRIPTLEVDPHRAQPVFLAELLDEESVVDFYENFAEVAFGAPRESIIKYCHITKYRSKEDQSWGDNFISNAGEHRRNKSDSKMDGSGAFTDVGAAKGGKSVGEKDGRIECMMTWTIKRDIFDNPSLIVINFLPISAEGEQTSSVGGTTGDV